MRFATLQTPAGPRVALATESGYVDLAAANPQLPTSLRELLSDDSVSLRAAADSVEGGSLISAAEVRLAPPITDPQKIVCIGLNYADHAAETGSPIPSEPVVFNKLSTTLRGPGDDIVLPPESDQVDYEAELVVVIGRQGHRIAEADALDYVAGYTCGHDVSARDWQKGKPAKQWLLGKSFDSFAPIGPVLVTADEIPDPNSLDVTLRLNGEVMQHSNTRQFIFSVQKLIAYLSNVCTLMPGDLIFTGTPPGVGMARTPPVFLQPGDQVEVEIEGIGVLQNQVVAG